MSAPSIDTTRTTDEPSATAGPVAVALVIAGAVLAVAAGVVLWASEGSAIFLESAVNAILTCF